MATKKKPGKGEHMMPDGKIMKNSEMKKMPMKKKMQREMKKKMGY